MKKALRLVAVVAICLTAATTSVSADWFPRKSVSGCAWFESFVLPPRKVIGGQCVLCLSASEWNGKWSGSGFFVDKEDYYGVRHVVRFKIDLASYMDEPDDLFPEGAAWYYLEGTGRHYEDWTYSGEIGFRLRVIDVGTPDGVADTLGLRLFELGGDPGNLDDVFYRAGAAAGPGTEYPSYGGLITMR